MTGVSNKNVLLIVAGGIAAFKVLDLVRLLRRDGAIVRSVLTEAGARFVTPLSLQALTEQPVRSDLWSLTDEHQMGHIHLARWADLVIVAPATADIMARMATGQANDLAAAILLVTDRPVLLAPAMNVRMWLHPATQSNVTILQTRGCYFVGPMEGEMACHEVGPGRMAEAAQLNDMAANLCEQIPDLAGISAIVSSGPTHEPIDPVRYLANRSSGKQGHAIASSLAAAGAKVKLVHGPVTLPPPPGVHTIAVETAEEMYAAVMDALPADVFVGAAAVADWRPADVSLRKLKKTRLAAARSISLQPTADIVAAVGMHPTLRPRLVVCFAAETEDLEKNARDKRVQKRSDWIVANRVGNSTNTFGGDDNEVTVLTADTMEVWEKMSKGAVARRLAQRIAGYFERGNSHGAA